MHFIKTSNATAGEVDLADRLSRLLLSGDNVLWLLSGGSNISTTAAILQLMLETPKQQLTVMLMDERYGMVGHEESNAHKLEISGASFDEASFIPVLKDEALEQTVTDYEQLVAKNFDAAQHVVGQFGIGPDGHIAGILPHSSIITSSRLVDSYVATDFTRISLTPLALMKIELGFAFAWGEPKKEALTTLRDKELSVTEQPAQLLKKIPEVYIYNDQIGENT